MIDIDNEIKRALKEGLKTRLSVLRALKTAVSTVLSTKGRTPGLKLQPEEEQAIIRAQIKQRQDSMDAFTKALRAEAAVKEAEEKLVLESLLPEQLTTEQLNGIIEIAIIASGATIKKEVQMVMGAIDIEPLVGRFDPKQLRRMIAEKLA